jgi:hypothetical protein
MSLGINIKFCCGVFSKEKFPNETVNCEDDLENLDVFIINIKDRII